MNSLAAILLVAVADVATPPTAAPHPPARAIRCDAKHHCVIARTLVDQLLSDTNALATTVRIVPALTDGKSDGFKLYAMRPGSVWRRLGFTNGDTLQSINGYELTSPELALVAYMQLRNTNDFAVRIVRRGQPLTLTYEIR